MFGLQVGKAGFMTLAAFFEVVFELHAEAGA